MEVDFFWILEEFNVSSLFCSHLLELMEELEESLAGSVVSKSNFGIAVVAGLKNILFEA